MSKKEKVEIDIGGLKISIINILVGAITALSACENREAIAERLAEAIIREIGYNTY